MGKLVDFKDFKGFIQFCKERDIVDFDSLKKYKENFSSHELLTENFENFVGDEIKKELEKTIKDSSLDISYHYISKEIYITTSLYEYYIVLIFKLDLKKGKLLLVNKDFAVQRHFCLTSFDNVSLELFKDANSIIFEAPKIHFLQICERHKFMQENQKAVYEATRELTTLKHLYRVWGDYEELEIDEIKTLFEYKPISPEKHKLLKKEIRNKEYEVCRNIVSSLVPSLIIENAENLRNDRCYFTAKSKKNNLTFNFFFIIEFYKGEWNITFNSDCYITYHNISDNKTVDYDEVKDFIEELHYLRNNFYKKRQEILVDFEQKYPEYSQLNKNITNLNHMIFNKNRIFERFYTNLFKPY